MVGKTARHQEIEHVGIRCPVCGSVQHRTVDSRPAPGNSVSRRKECASCHTRFNTKEQFNAAKHKTGEGDPVVTIRVADLDKLLNDLTELKRKVSSMKEGK